MSQAIVQNPDAVRAAIEALNLDPIKVKLMDKREGKGWSRFHVDRVEIQYKRFLFMSVTESTSIVPTQDIDAFWHQHILDTRKYAQDCEVTFGYFLHHFPYFGMRGEQDAKNLSTAFEQTQVIYARLFGEPLVDPVDVSAKSQCGHRGGGGSRGCGSCCVGGEDVHAQLASSTEIGKNTVISCETCTNCETGCSGCGIRDDARPQFAASTDANAKSVGGSTRAGDLTDKSQSCSGCTDCSSCSGSCGVRDNDVMRVDLRP